MYVYIFNVPAFGMSTINFLLLTKFLTMPLYSVKAFASTTMKGVIIMFKGFLRNCFKDKN